MNFTTETDHCGVLSSSSLKTNKIDDFYRHLLYNSESSRSLITGYNYFIDNILPNIFLGEYLIKTSSSQFEKRKVIKVIVDFPKNNLGERITPHITRTCNISYMCPIYLEVENNTSFSPTSTLEHIGSIPCMVGSNRCYTSYKPDEYKTIEDWKMYCSECPTSVGGYFINRGMEKVIINQEKIRTCFYLTVLSKDKIPRIFTTITCINGSETNVIRIQSGKERPTIYIILTHTKGKQYPFYLVFYLLLITYKKTTNSNVLFDFDKIDNIICSFVPENEHDQIKIALIPNRNEFIENFVHDNRIDDEKIRKYIEKKINDKLKIEEILDLVFTDSFKQCNTVAKKIVNLCYMASQHLRCFLKNRNFDSRDSWLNKKIDAPQRTIELLVNVIFSGMKLEPDFKLMKKSLDVMEKTFKTSFNSYGWGYGRAKKENVSEAIKNDSYLAYIGQISKVNTPVDRRITGTTIRGVSATQMGILCPVETPEGETCGLIKHLSALCHISYNRFYENERNIVINQLYNENDYLSSFTKGNNCKYLLNIKNELLSLKDNNGIIYPLYISKNFVKKVKEILAFNYPNSEKWIKFTQSKTNNELIQLNIFIDISFESMNFSHWSDNSFSISIPPILYNTFNQVFGIVNDFFSIVKQQEYPYSFSINGDFFVRNDIQFYPTIIYVSPTKLVTELKMQRRNKKLPIDSCIYKNDIDFSVQYHDDSGRCMAPYLIVDTDGELIADKKFLWDKINKSDYQNSKDYIDLFYNEGAMELLDVKEYNSIFLANTIEEVRAFSKLRKFLNEFLENEFITEDEHYIKGKMLIDNRECDNYIASIRRSYEYLLLIPLSLEYGIRYLQDNFKFLEDISILYKLNIYLNTRFMFTHSFINPNSIFSAGANTAPKANHQSGPRFTYQAAMIKQSLSLGNLVDYTRFDAGSKKQIMSRRTSFETIAEQPLLLNTIPVTQNVIIMIGCHSNNYEDPTVMSKSYANRMMRYQKDEVFKTSEIHTNQYVDKFTRPDNDINSKNKNRYRHLGDDGLPKLGSIIKAGDCIIGKVRTIINTGEQKSNCIFAGIGDYGEVTAIRLACSEESSENCRTLCVKISQRRYQIIGDKLAMRFAQKGVIGDMIGGEEDINYLGKIIDDNEMPIVRGGPNHGMKPDLIFNPAGFPSRMTCGMLIEILTSKASLYTDERVNASNFHTLDMNHYYNILNENGLDKFANEFMSHSDGEIMMDSTTGKEYKAFVGMCSYQILRHQVKDKIQCRALGKNDPLTRQASKGRSVGGGLRNGEMESSAFMAHGASYIAVERLMHSSDEYRTLYCTSCNQISSDTQSNDEECHFCKKIGSKTLGIHPRVFLCFMQIMYGLGVSVKTILKKKK